MPLLYLFIMALSQFYLSWMSDHQLFDYEVFFYGNMQVIIVIWIYRTIQKYIHIGE